MAIALATIRRYAKVLRMSRVKITLKSLAGAIGCSHQELAEYLDSVDGLREEIGLRSRVQKIDRSGERYLWAKAMLEDRDLVVTARRMAFLSKKNVRSVYQWLRRNDWLVEIVGKDEFKRRCDMQRMRWVCRLTRHKHFRKLNVVQLAADSGVDRSLLYRLFRKQPGFYEELDAIIRGDLLNTSPPD